VSISSSIFQKPCPACAASVSVSAARCDCGHDFESSAHPLSTLETTIREEELYESYLAARAEQARQAARTADEALANEASASGNQDHRARFTTGKGRANARFELL